MLLVSVTAATLDAPFCVNLNELHAKIILTLRSVFSKVHDVYTPHLGLTQVLESSKLLARGFQSACEREVNIFTQSYLTLWPSTGSKMSTGTIYKGARLEIHPDQSKHRLHGINTG